MILLVLVGLAELGFALQWAFTSDQNANGVDERHQLAYQLAG